MKKRMLRAYEAKHGSLDIYAKRSIGIPGFEMGGLIDRGNYIDYRRRGGLVGLQYLPEGGSYDSDIREREKTVRDNKKVFGRNMGRGGGRVSANVEAKNSESGRGFGKIYSGQGVREERRQLGFDRWYAHHRRGTPDYASLGRLLEQDEKDATP
jgi:hypothetical protein